MKEFELSFTCKLLVYDNTDPFPDSIRNVTHLPFFQSINFAELLRLLGDKYVWFIVSDSDSNILFSLLIHILNNNKKWSSWFTTRAIALHGPFIAATFNFDLITKTFEIVLQEIPCYTLYLQIRNNEISNESLQVHFKKLGFFFSDRLNLLTSIQSREVAWNNLSPSRRRQIRLSLRNGLNISEPLNLSDIEAFYKILQQLYSRIHKPLPILDFFVTIWEISRKKESRIFFLLAYYNQNVVGGILVPWEVNGKAYEWYIGALDKELKDKHVYPSVLLTWSAMEKASHLGCHIFDFMGMGNPYKPYGVRDFKLKFGGQTINPGRWNKIICPWLYYPVEIAYNINFILKKMLMLANKFKLF